MSARRIVHVLRTGKLEYLNGLHIQQKIIKTFNSNLENDFRNILIITEHHPVYTIGLRAKSYTIEEENSLKNLGAQFYKTNRGGLITFHGPGQLVAYPILNLKFFKPSIRWYVQQIENCVINTCKQFGINAATSSETGVWVGDRKICAIGIHGARYITSHGLALNCNTDLKWFDHIVPCGIVGKGVTSISKELNETVTVDETIPFFLKCFSLTFSCKTTELSECERNNILYY